MSGDKHTGIPSDIGGFTEADKELFRSETEVRPDGTVVRSDWRRYTQDAQEREAARKKGGLGV